MKELTRNADTHTYTHIERDQKLLKQKSNLFAFLVAVEINAV